MYFSLKFPVLLRNQKVWIAKTSNYDFYRYLLEEKSDDSILMLLVIRIMDALGNYGNRSAF